MVHQQKIVLRNEGHHLPDTVAGDVVAILKETPHAVFRRSDHDLIMTKSISITEALCGFDLVIKHLDGRDLVVKSDPGTVIKNNSLKCIEGEGMPFYKNPCERGNLFIKFQVRFLLITLLNQLLMNFRFSG